MRSAVERATQSDLPNQGPPKNLAVWPIGIRDQHELNPHCLYSMSNSREAQDTLSLPMLKASQQVHPRKNDLTQRLTSLGEATRTASIAIANVTHTESSSWGVREIVRIYLSISILS